MSEWPAGLPAIRVRVARQTDQLEALKRFYCDGLGLEVIGSFTGHAGYDGLIVGLPGKEYQLEFVHHQDGSPGQSSNKENLLVFYIEDAAAAQQMVAKLNDMGYPSVPAENPWWDDHNAYTIEDPDGYRVVLQPV